MEIPWRGSQSSNLLSFSSGWRAAWPASRSLLSAILVLRPENREIPDTIQSGVDHFKDVLVFMALIQYPWTKIFEVVRPPLPSIVKSIFLFLFTPLGGARCFICPSETFLLVFWLSRLCFLADFVDQKLYGLTKLFSFRWYAVQCHKVRAKGGCHAQIRRRAWKGGWTRFKKWTLY